MGVPASVAALAHHGGDVVRLRDRPREVSDRMTEAVHDHGRRFATLRSDNAQGPLESKRLARAVFSLSHAIGENDHDVAVLQGRAEGRLCRAVWEDAERNPGTAKPGLDGSGLIEHVALDVPRAGEGQAPGGLSLIHISEPTRLGMISY